MPGQSLQRSKVIPLKSTQILYPGLYSMLLAVAETQRCWDLTIIFRWSVAEEGFHPKQRIPHQKGQLTHRSSPINSGSTLQLNNSLSSVILQQMSVFIHIIMLRSSFFLCCDQNKRSFRPDIHWNNNKISLKGQYSVDGFRCWAFGNGFKNVQKGMHHVP